MLTRILFFNQTLNFSFCIEVKLFNDVVGVAGELPRDSATHGHVSILP